MSRKRERPNQSGNHYPKRRRPSFLQSDTADDSTSILSTTSSAAGKQQNTVVVNGLPTDCSVLDLKSRFEIYGSISRTRIDPNGLAYITFRSHDSANSAVSAALDPSFRLTLLSKQVQVMWASDPVPKWREGVAKKDGGVSSSGGPLSSSRLVRAEVPLSRRGRGNKLDSAIVNPRVKDNNNNTEDEDEDEDDEGGRGVKVPVLGLNGPFKGREIVAYDDIL